MLYPRVTLLIEGSDDDAIALSPAVVAALGLEGRRRLRVCLGQGETDLTLKADGALPPELGHVGRGAALALGLPGALPLELKAEAGALRLGPVIGLLLPDPEAPESEALAEGEADAETAAALGALRDRLLPFPQLRGLVVAFTPAALQSAGPRIPGWRYDPAEEAFEDGIFPFPSAVYIPGPTPSGDTLARLRARFGPALFNQPLPEGAELLGAIRRDPALAPCLKRGDELGEAALFSLYLQRDQSQSWRLTAHLGRALTLEAPGASKEDGAPQPAPMAASACLTGALGLGHEAAFVATEEMAHLAFGLAERLDGLGARIGELVVDLTRMSDGSLRLRGLPRTLWVPEVALALGDGILYHRLLTTPLFYAKALAGYPATAS